MALKVDLRPGQEVVIGDVVVKMVKKSGQLASLVIVADRSIPISEPRDSSRQQACRPLQA